MIQLSKTILVSFLAVSLFAACGKNAAQDWQTQNDNVVVQPGDIENAADDIAAEIAASEQGPSFITSTNSAGDVYGAFANQRIMSQDQAIQLAQSGQLQFRPIQNFLNANDAEFQLRQVNSQSGFSTGDASNNSQRRVRTVRRQQRQGVRYVDVDVSQPLTRREIRQVVRRQVRRATVQSQFFEMMYVAVPMQLEYAYVVPQPSFFQQPTTFSTVSNCNQQLSAFAVGNSCVQPFSVSTQTFWQLQVSCTVPATVPGQYVIQQSFPQTASYDANGTYLQVFF